jgi:hypothetical protein
VNLWTIGAKSGQLGIRCEAPTAKVCLVGQVFVDVTLPTRGQPLKLRAAGIMHACYWLARVAAAPNRGPLSGRWEGGELKPE